LDVSPVSTYLLAAGRVFQGINLLSSGPPQGALHGRDWVLISYGTLRGGRAVPEPAKHGDEAVERAGLEVWENPSPERDYTIEITYPEFTCVCPRSGYPDFATIRLVYTPDRLVVELKSYKLYLNSFRDTPISHEAVTNRIFDDLGRAVKPRRMEVTGDFNVRGNVKTVVKVALP